MNASGREARRRPLLGCQWQATKQLTVQLGVLSPERRRPQMPGERAEENARKKKREGPGERAQRAQRIQAEARRARETYLEGSAVLRWTGCMDADTASAADQHGAICAMSETLSLTHGACCRNC